MLAKCSVRLLKTPTRIARRALIDLRMNTLRVFVLLLTLAASHPASQGVGSIAARRRFGKNLHM